MKYAIAWGCLVPSRRSLIGYEASTRKVLDELGVEYLDLPNETCCAPFWMQSLDLTTSIALAARNLAKVETMGLNLITPCSGCFHSYKRVNHTLSKYPEMKSRVNEILGKAGLRYRGTVEAYHLVDFLYNEIGLQTLRKHVTTDLQGLEIGLRYGCHMLKPHELLNIEYSERPTFADEILEAIGLTSIQYTGRHRCCGGLLRGVNDDLADQVLTERLKDASTAKLDAIVTVCSLCHLQHDMGQKIVSRKSSIDGMNMPVIHFPQLIALAFGFQPTELGLDLHTVKTTPFLEKMKGGAI